MKKPSSFTKIKITYKTAVTVKTTELAIGVLNEGYNKIAFGTNTTAIPYSESFTTKTLDIRTHEDAGGRITDLQIGTMAYTEDYSGTCGLMKGDCIYIQSIEFVA